MKKFTLLAIMFIAATFTFSQTPLTTAVNFSGTDIYGNEFDLFEKLDGGQYVCLDFWFST